MRHFSCPTCGFRVYFEDEVCVRCETQLVYDVGEDGFTAGRPGCRNREVFDCNWVEQSDSLCRACLRMEFSYPVEAAWEAYDFSVAIRRVLRQLILAKIPVEDMHPLLTFRLRRSTDDEPVTVGHSNGVITLDIREGDTVYRERIRTQLLEKYRTPLGHVRHEVGHWDWAARVQPSAPLLQRFRQLFGDDTVDYQAALQGYYETGRFAPQGSFLTMYASAHPWEDYAESYAHVLHMTDTLETARAEGLTNRTAKDMEELFAQWVQVSTSLNELTRSMGAEDPYPFALSNLATAKLGFVLTSGPHFAGVRLTNR